MPRKSKRVPSGPAARILSLLALLTAAVLAGFSDWYVHQPHAWQLAHAKRVPPPLAFAFSRLGNSVADATDSLGLTGHDAEATLARPLATNQVFCAGLPKRLPACKAPNDLVVLSKRGFVVGYSPSLRHPVWVAYSAHPAHGATPPPRPTLFKPDPAAPNSPAHKEYSKSGYDRGHMAPNLAIATRYGRAAQEQTFLTSNVCPQRSGLNQGPWCDVEFRIAEPWADRFDDVWVIAGALPDPGGKRLPSGIEVPAAFYQVVVAQKKNRLRAFAVCMPQTLRRGTPARTTLLSIDDLEKLTGFDFLSELPDDVEAKLESETPTRLLPSGLAGYFRILYQHLRRYD